MADSLIADAIRQRANSIASGDASNGAISDDIQQYAQDQSDDAAEAASGHGTLYRGFASGVNSLAGSSVRAAASIYKAATGNETPQMDAYAAQKYKNAERYARIDKVPSFKDVTDMQSALHYLEFHAAEMAPTVGSMFVGGGVGGIAARGLSEGAQIAARGLGILAPTELSEVGQVLDAQKAQSGKENVGEALALGSAANALNLVGGVGGRVARGLPTKMVEKRVLNSVAQGAVTGVEQAGVATGQQALSELGRKGVDDNYDIAAPEVKERFLESAASGFAAGSAFGGVHGALAKNKVRPSAPTVEENTAAGEPTQVLQLEAPRINQPAGPITDNGQKALPRPATLDVDPSKVYPANQEPGFYTDMFHGSTPETLRPVGTAKDMVRAIGSPEDDATVRLGSAVHGALKDGNPDLAEKYVSMMVESDDLTAANQGAAQRALTVIDSYRQRADALRGDRTPTTTQPIDPVEPSNILPKQSDELGKLAEMAPTLPKFPDAGEFKSAIALPNDKSQTWFGKRLDNVVRDNIGEDPTQPNLDIVLKKLDEVSQDLESADITPEVLGKRLKMIDNARKVVMDHVKAIQQYHADRPAFDALLEQATSPEPQKPPTLPQVTSTDVLTKPASPAFEAPQQGAPPPPVDPQKERRGTLLQEALRSNEPFKVWNSGTKNLYTQDQAAWRRLTEDEHSALLDRMQQIADGKKLQEQAELAKHMQDQQDQVTQIANETQAQLDKQQAAQAKIAEKAAKKAENDQNQAEAAARKEEAKPAQGELFNEREVKPTGRTKEKRRAAEVAAREAVFPTSEIPEKPTPKTGEQSEMFTKKGEPTKAALGESRTTVEENLKRAREQETRASKQVLDKLNQLIKENPTEVTARERISIAKLLTGERKKPGPAAKAVEGIEARIKEKKAQADLKAAHDKAKEKVAEEKAAAEPAPEPKPEPVVEPKPEPVVEKPKPRVTLPVETMRARLNRKVENGEIEPQDAVDLYNKLDSDNPEDHAAAQAGIFPTKAKPEEPSGKFSRVQTFRNPSEFSQDPAERIAQMQKVVDDTIKDWKNPPKIELVDPRRPANNDQKLFVRDALRQEADLMGGEVRGYYDERSGKVMIPITGPGTPEAVRSAIFHEALGHYGLREAFKKNLDGIMDDLYFKNAELREFADAYAERYGTDLRTGIEEAFVERLEANPDIHQGWFTRIKTMLQQFARRMGWRRGEFTNDEVNAIIRQTVKAVRDRGPETPNPEPTRPVGRRVTENGTFFKRQSQPTTPAATGSYRSDNIAEALEKRGVPHAIVNAAINADNWTRKVKMGFAFGHKLQEIAERYGVSQYKDYFNWQQRQQATANKYNRDLQVILQRAAQSSDVARLNSSLKHITLSQKWGYQPTWLKEKVQIDPAAKAYWDALPEDVRKSADEIFKYGNDSRAALQEAVHSYINQDAKDSLAAALTDADRKAIERRRVRQLNLFDKGVPKLPGPYAPLSRFGNYVAVAKSKRYVELEKLQKQGPLSEADKAEFEDMRADPNHYAVFFRDTLAQARDKSVEMKKTFDGGQVYHSSRTLYYGQIGDSPMLQMQKLKEMLKDGLGDSDLSAATNAKIDTMMKDLYITTLAEQSARKHDTRREKVAGADDNMLKSLSYKGRADAHFLSQMLHRNEINTKFKSMLDTINADKENPQYQERKDFIQEVAMRHVTSLVRDDTPLADAALGFSSIYHLAMSPRYYINNATQPAMVTVPWLAGKHGYARSWAALVGGYRDLKPLLDAVKKSPLESVVDIESFKNLTANERAMLMQARDHGLLDIGMSSEFGQFDVTKGATKELSRFQNAARAWANHVEVANRVTSALAAYRLGVQDRMSHAEAMDWAEKTLSKTQFDYGSINAPRYYNQLNRGLIGKSALQFRKYTMNQISLFLGMGRSILDSSADPAERAVAAKQLGYMMGHLLVVAGAVGLPGAQLAGVVGSALFGEEDQPINGDKFIEDSIRKLVGDGDLAQMLTRGAPNPALGIEMSTLGLGSLLNPVPFGDYTKLDTQQGALQFAAAAMGPVVGMLPQFGNALSYLEQGDYTKAAINALPSGPSYMLKTYDQSQRGVTNRKGDQLLSPDEISHWNTLMSALGFPSTTQLTQQRLASANYQFDQYFKDRVSQLKFAYTQAAKQGDAQTMSDVRDQWARLNEAKVKTGFKATPIGDLLKAPAAQKKREAATVAGVQQRPGNTFVQKSLGE